MESGEFQTIQRAALVMDALSTAAASGGLRFTDIMNATGLGRSTTHRVLAGLTAEGFVDKCDDSGRFSLGAALFEIFNASVGQAAVLSRAAPVLQGLCEDTADTVYFSVRLGDEAACIARLEGAFPIRTLTLSEGDRRPLGIGAGSLALLAFAPEEDRGRVLESNDQAFAAYGLTRDQVAGLCDAARRRGYSFNDGGIVSGMSAIGVPVYGADTSSPAAALSIAAISDRLAQPRRDDLAGLLAAAVPRLQIDLGAFLSRSGLVQIRRSLSTGHSVPGVAP